MLQRFVSNLFQTIFLFLIFYYSKNNKKSDYGFHKNSNISNSNIFKYICFILSIVQIYEYIY